MQEKKYDISNARLLAEAPVEESKNDHGFLPVENPKITQQATNDSDSQDRMLQSSTIVIDLQIIATPDSSVFPSPYELALSLNNKLEQLDAGLSNFDTSYVITATEFTRYYPVFPTTPSIEAFDIEWAYFKGQLNNYGWIFISCVKASQDFGKPSPYQIWRGFDSRNLITPSGSVEVSQAFKDFYINITGLEPETEYNAYVIGGSAHPGYPDLMKSSSIVTITFTTLPPKVSKKFLFR